MLVGVRCDVGDIWREIRKAFPRGWFFPNFIYVFFMVEVDGEKGERVFRYDFVFSEKWLNSTSVKRLGLEGENLFRVYTPLTNPALWRGMNEDEGRNDDAD